MLAGRECGKRHRRVGGRDGEVEDRLDLGVVVQLVRGEGADAVVLGDGLRPRCVEVGGGDHFGARQLAQVLEVRLADRSGADDAHLQRLAHRSPLSMIVRTSGVSRSSSL
jgi:hypothetical protein